MDSIDIIQWEKWCKIKKNTRLSNKSYEIDKHNKSCKTRILTDRILNDFCGFLFLPFICQTNAFVGGLFQLLILYI